MALSAQNPLTPKKMNWHIALIYFILWLMAFMSLMNGLMSVFGVQVGPTADGGMGIALHVYPSMEYPQLFILDGVFSLMMSMYAVFVRFQLAGFKRRAPIYLTILFALNILESILYAVMLNVLVPEMVAASAANGANIVMNTVAGAVLSAVVAALNWVYYSRRREMFNK